MKKLVPICNRFDEYETRAYNFPAAQESLPSVWMESSGSSLVKPLQPERFFFVAEPESNSQSIPVVSRGKSVRSVINDWTGAGTQVNAHPPLATDEALNVDEGKQRGKSATGIAPRLCGASYER